MEKRKCGVLLPIFSLPSSEGIGTIGRNAYNFVDFLSDSGMNIWQVLPLNPTNYGDSPYQSCCSNALNYYFIDTDMLIEEGLLTRKEVEISDLGTNARHVDYSKQFTQKIKLLRKAFERFNLHENKFLGFVAHGRYNDFATFMTLKCAFGHKAWSEWKEPYRTYNAKVVNEYLTRNSNEFLFWQFTQYIFLRQWNALKDYAHSKNIEIMGDIPLYLAYDSVEMWKYGDKLFMVDEYRRPECVAGVPPDAFCDDGQLWGNPLYDWKKMRRDGYKWWNERINECLDFFDILRIDHFRGFDRFYAVKAGSLNARKGEWLDGPKEELFKDKLDYKIVAEDLGVIDDGVRRLMKNVGYPGMKILEFAFDGSPDNEHKPSNFTHNYVCYTGTHDNMPLAQYIADLKQEELYIYKQDLASECEKAGVEADFSSPQSICLSVVKLAFASIADTVIIPMWDLLCMGGEARINLPSTVSDKNWSWRFVKEDFDTKTKEFLRNCVKKDVV